MEEKLKTYKIEPLFEHFNEYHKLKPFGYQFLIIFLINNHLKETEQSISSLISKNFAWVLVSMSFEIVNEVTEMKDYFGKTWYSGKTGPYYRREFMIFDNNNKVFIKGASFSVLINLENRSIYRDKILPFKSFNETNEYLIDCSPRFKEEHEFKTIIEEKNVLNSYLDPFGHVNNLRYTEFIYDTLTKEEVKKLDKIKRIDLFFHKELTNDELFNINGNFLKERRVYEIINLETKMKAFSAVFTLIKV